MKYVMTIVMKMKANIAMITAKTTMKNNADNNMKFFLTVIFLFLVIVSQSSFAKVSEAVSKDEYCNANGNMVFELSTSILTFPKFDLKVAQDVRRVFLADTRKQAEKHGWPYFTVVAKDEYVRWTLCAMLKNKKVAPEELRFKAYKMCINSLEKNIEIPERQISCLD